MCQIQDGRAATVKSPKSGSGLRPAPCIKVAGDTWARLRRYGTLPAGTGQAICESKETAARQAFAFFSFFFSFFNGPRPAPSQAQKAAGRPSEKAGRPTTTTEWKLKQQASGSVRLVVGNAHFNLGEADTELRQQINVSQPIHHAGSLKKHP